MTLTDQMIALVIILMAVCFLLGIAGVAVEGWTRLRAWKKSDKWTQQNENWQRWMKMQHRL